MENYYYKGYLIEKNFNGYFQIDNMEFVSLDEATEWIDEMSATESSVSNMHTYFVTYVDFDDFSDSEYVNAISEQEARRYIRKKYPRAQVTECFRVDT